MIFGQIYTQAGVGGLVQTCTSCVGGAAGLLQDQGETVSFIMSSVSHCVCLSHVGSELTSAVPEVFFIFITQLL